MEEKILIRSNSCINIRLLFQISIILLIVLFVGICIFDYISLTTPYVDIYSKHWSDISQLPYTYNDAGNVFHDSYQCDYFINGFTQDQCICEVYSDSISYAWSNVSALYYSGTLIPAILFFCSLSILFSLIYYSLKGHQLVVTDKRIYGTVGFGKSVVIPNDSISAIVYIPSSKGVGVFSSSGKINFLLIRNAAEIFETLNNLLIQRQHN